MDSVVSAPTKAKAKLERFAYFEEVVSNGNHVCLRRWASFGVRIVVCEGCEACVALEETLKSLPCVRWLERVIFPSADSGEDSTEQPKVVKKTICHRTIELLAPSQSKSGCDLYRKGETIGTLQMPITGLATVLHRELMSTLRIKPLKPLPHQVAYAEQFGEAKWPQLPPGILLGFGLGSGKTHAALLLAELRGERDLLIVCAVSLIGQWRESIEQHGPKSVDAPISEFSIYGYSNFSDAISKNEHLVKKRMAIVDEAHYYKNLNSAVLPAIEALRLSTCVQLLTGTPIRNDSRDMDFILIMLGLQQLIPKELEGEAGRGNAAWKVKNGGAPPPDPYGSRSTRKNLLEHLRGRVALYNPRYCEPFAEYASHYPQIKETTKYHELTWQQVAERFINGGGVSTGSGKSGGLLRHLSIFAAVRDPVDKNIVYSSKNTAVLADIKSLNRYPQVVYSRFKENLLEPLKLLIEKELGVRVEKLDGSTPAKMRQPLLNRFNVGKIDVLLICAVGSEGLDLNIQVESLKILEPQRNVPEAQQIVGRVVRYSKKKRDVDVPKIDVVNYVAKFPKKSPSDLATRSYLVKLVKPHPAIVSGFKGKADTFDEDVNLVVEYLCDWIDESGGQTDEESSSKRNSEKYSRTRPLDVLLWMASTTVATPECFCDEWAVICGARKPSELRQKEEIKEKERKCEDEKEKKKRKREAEEKKILFWKERAENSTV